MTSEPIDSDGRPARLPGMDALRSLLMLLGVLIHAADPYALATRWLVRDPQGSPVFDALVDSIHLFRMPAFFLVSGYFSMRLLRGRATSAFLHERLRRIGVPLLATLLTVNLLQVLWLAPAAASPVAVLLAAWRDGRWIGHLWFLAYLLAFCAMAAALAPLLRRLALPRRWPAAATIAVLLLLGTAAALLPPALAHWRPQWSTALWLGAIDPLDLLDYLPFFAVGLLLETDAVLLWQFSRLDGTVLLSGMLAGLAAHASADLPGVGMRTLHVLALAALTWIAVRVAFGLSRRWLGTPSPAWRYLSDASYSVYLLHHLVVVLAASWLAALAWPIAAKFVLVAALALGLPLAAHHFLILRRPWLRYLFNGKRIGPRDDALGIRDAGSAPR